MTDRAGGLGPGHLLRCNWTQVGLPVRSRVYLGSTSSGGTLRLPGGRDLDTLGYPQLEGAVPPLKTIFGVVSYCHCVWFENDTGVVTFKMCISLSTKTGVEILSDRVKCLMYSHGVGHNLLDPSNIVCQKTRGGVWMVSSVDLSSRALDIKIHTPFYMCCFNW